MPRSIFDITPVELGQLGPEPAVAALREMLWAEFNNLGIRITDADPPFAVLDGGLDAVVKTRLKGVRSELIFAPRTWYQVTIGDFALGPMSPEQIEKLLISPTAIAARVKAQAEINGKSHKRENISLRVRECLDGGGTLVMMFFGKDGIDAEAAAAENATREFLTEIDPQYADAKIKVWLQSRICELLRQFPAVSLQIKNLQGFQLLTHNQWADRVEMRQEFVLAAGRQKVIDSVRTAIRDDSQGPVHVRLIGKSGSGKTRLMLEALRSDELKSLVLYADEPKKVTRQVVSAVHNAKHARMILVVDECRPETRSKLVRIFASQAPTLKVVSIHQNLHETDSASDYRLLNVPPLFDEEIEKIIKGYGVDAAAAAEWAVLSEGSPRVGHVIGKTLREQRSISDRAAHIWDRFVAPHVGGDTEEYQEIRVVLSSLALLFKNSPRSLSPALREKGIRILLSWTRRLLEVKTLQIRIVDALSELCALPDLDKRKIISTIETVLDYDAAGLPDDVVSRLVALRDALVGASFHSRLHRYAGIDLLQDHYDRDGRESNKIEKDIQKLAGEALAAPEMLRSELKWLVTRRTKNSYQFGCVFGRLDAEFEAWPDIRDTYFAAGKDGHDYFVGGYLRSVYEREPMIWEKIISEIADQDGNQEHLLGLIQRSGINDNVAGLILRLIKAGEVPPESLCMFSMGRASDPLSDATFAKWLDFLISVGSFSASCTALNLASRSLLGERKLSAVQLEKVLTQPALFRREGRWSQVMLSHYWLELCRVLIKLKPDAERIVLRCILDNMGNPGAITASLGANGDQYLDRLVSLNAAEAWQMASQYIKPPVNARGLAIARWLRGNMSSSAADRSPMRHIARKDVLLWIEADPGPRVAYVANMRPKDLTHEGWRDSLIRELLCRFGDSNEVRSALVANFVTCAWTSSVGGHYAAQKDILMQLISGETNPNALRWLNDAVAATESKLEAAEIEEEALGCMP
jgi:hypothetical protein